MLCRLRLNEPRSATAARHCCLPTSSHTPCCFYSHPDATGIVMTDISRDMGLFFKVGHAIFGPVMNLFCKQPKAGAFTR